MLSKNRQRNGATWIFKAVRSDDRDQLQLHFNAENDEPALDLFIVKQSKVRKPGTVVPLKQERDISFAPADFLTKGKGKGKSKGQNAKGKSKGPSNGPTPITAASQNAQTPPHSDDEELPPVPSDDDMEDNVPTHGLKRKDAEKSDKGAKLSPVTKKSKPCLPPGARRVPNPGGGNCLYHALAQAESKPGKLRSHRQLRAFLHAYLTKHCAKFSPFWDQRGPDDQLFAGSWEEYLETMSKDKSWGGYMDIGAYSEATDRPCLVLHPKDEMVHCFNSQASGEAVCLVYESQHYELLLCGDDELREIWQRAEDGCYSGYRGAAKSKASLKLSDFASEKSLKLSDYASCKTGRPGRVLSNKFVKSRKGMSKSSIADAQSSGSCAARRVTSDQPAEQPAMDSHSWTCPLCNVTVSAVGPKKAIYTARYNDLRYRHKGVPSRSVIGTRTVAPVCQERTTTMSTPATVGVDDDLAASETGITLRTTNDELARRIDVQVSVAAVQADGRLAILQLDLLKSALDHLLLNLLVHLLHAWGSHLSSLVALALLAAHGLQRLSVLSGNHHGVDLLWLNGAIRVLQVLNGHLGLAIWAQPPALTALANISQGLAQTRGHGVGQRHAVRCLIAGISKHDALVTGTHVQVLLVHMDAAGNVRALLVDAHQHFAALVAQSLAVHAGQVIHKAVKTDLCHDSSHNLVIVQLGLSGDLTCHHDHVVLGCSLASHLALGVHLEACIQHCIGHLVADLVRMALVDRLGREEESAAGAGLLLRRLGHGYNRGLRGANRQGKRFKLWICRTNERFHHPTGKCKKKQGAAVEADKLATAD